jgi:hypothetical protein
MTALVKYKNPTEYSFYIWMRNYPESSHWADTERFCKFVKTVCVFNAKKWKDVNYLEKRILDEKPNFDPENLQDKLIAFEHMIDFYKAPPMSRCWVIEEVEAEKNNYIERGIKNGKFYEIQKAKK